MKTESLFHSDPEDIFAKAIERVEAGETVDAVLATVPEPMRAELREVLLLITATHHLQRTPVPQPSAPRRAERKRAFLEAAAQMKAESALAPTPVVAPTIVASTPQAKAPLWAGLANFWRDLQASFAVPNLRLAPLIMLIVAVYLGAFGFISAAEAASIGDPVYIVKRWMRDQRLNLSSVAGRGAIYNENIADLLADLATTADVLKAEEQQTGSKVARITTERLIFGGFAGDYLVSEPFRVLLRYQPDPNRPDYRDMYIPVTPGDQQLVEVTFQVLPGDDPNSEFPFILQGISLQVPTVEIPVGPTPTPEPTATATATATVTPCELSRPTGWVPYIVREGDTLSSIAQRAGATVAQLQQVNCLADANAIREGARLFAPALQQASTPVGGQPDLKVTLTAISTVAVTPTVEMTATATVVPTLTVTITPTTDITATVTPTATATLTDSGLQTPTPPMTVTVTLTTTGEPTLEATPTITGTPLAPTTPVTGTVEPANDTPTATATATVDGETTATATPTSTPTPAEAEATPTPSATAAAIETPTAGPLPTVTTSGKDGDSAAPPTPTSDGNGGGAGGGQAVATPTNTPSPQNKSPLTGG